MRYFALVLPSQFLFIYFFFFFPHPSKPWEYRQWGRECKQQHPPCFPCCLEGFLQKLWVALSRSCHTSPHKWGMRCWRGCAGGGLVVTWDTQACAWNARSMCGWKCLLSKHCRCLISLPPDSRTRHFSPCGHANLTSVRATPAWGFASSCASAAALRSESEASGVSSAQLHPPFAARFTLEVTGAES